MQLKYVVENGNKIINLFNGERKITDIWVVEEQHYTDVETLFKHITEKYGNCIYFDNMIEQIFQGMVNFSDRFDVRYKLSISEKMERLVTYYSNKRDAALLRISELHEKGSEISMREDEELFNLINNYKFDIKYESQFSKMLSGMSSTLDDIRGIIHESKK